MQTDINSIWAAMRDTVQQPRRGARRVMGLNLSMSEAALALLSVAVVTAIISALVGQMVQGSPPAQGGAAAMVAISPVQWAVLQVASMFVAAALITGVGRSFGGQGTFAQAAALLAWAEFIVLMVQIAQVIAMFVLPPAAVILAFAGIGLTVWLLVNFVAELHGFTSLIKVFFGMIGVGFMLMIVIATIMAALIGAPGA